MLLTSTVAALGFLTQGRPFVIQRPTAAPTQSPEIAAWKRSKASALSLAQKSDARMAALRNVGVKQSTAIRMPKRNGGGQMVTESYVASPNVFAIWCCRVSFNAKQEIASVRYTSNGTRAQVFEPNSPVVIRTTRNKIQLSSKATPTDWTLRQMEIALGGVLGEAPLTALVRRALAKGSGYQVRVDERVVRRLNVPIKQYRIGVAKVGAAAKGTGEMQVNIVLDAKEMLPTAIATQCNLKQKEPLELTTSYAWRKSKKPLPASLFELRG